MPLDSWVESLFSSSSEQIGRMTRKNTIEIIPPEVLLLVFEEYCRKSPQFGSSTPLEFHLTHVCQYWRSLALGISTLWTKLSIASNTPLPIALAYLHRSQSLPLDLDVDLRHDAADEKERQHILELWGTIKLNSHRWRRLTVRTGPHGTTSFSEELPDLETPLLEDLCILSDSIMAESMKPLDMAPSLKLVRLEGISILPFTPSLGQITRLHLMGHTPMPISIFREVMSQMAQLEELTLRDSVVQGWPRYPSTEDIVTLPALAVLKLSDRRWPLFVPLLSINAPTLRSLALYDLVSHDLPEPPIESQISAQYPSIRNLTITGKSSFIDDVSLAQLARMFYTVDHFALLDVDSTFVLESCQNLHEPSLWPMLQTLSMIPAVAENILCSLISMRRPTAKEVGLKDLLCLPLPNSTERSGSANAFK
ncbi:hypothetical protein BJ912DRAFT_434301 [Pholiota molesta]|nr:hypothetical protein BJ912DRAFT_434301 [Pholiota molesta]